MHNLGRVRLKKGISKEFFAFKFCNLFVYLSSEFGEVLDIVGYKIYLFIRRQGSCFADQVNWLPIELTECKLQLNSYNIKFKVDGLLPSGTYQLKICLNNEQINAIPYLSDFFQLHTVNLISNIPQLSMLTNYREITNVSYKSVYIKEEYGAAIGSHIWDSSIVLSEYIFQHPIHALKDKPCVCLELGAGCGLVGISIASNYLNTLVILSDKIEVMSYLNENIDINSIMNNCYAMNIDWMKCVRTSLLKMNNTDTNDNINYMDEIQSYYKSYLEKSKLLSGLNRLTINSNVETLDSSEISILSPLDTAFSSLSSSNGSNSSSFLIDIIIAADVLYDHSIAELFFDTVRYFAIPNHTVIYIAQKNRGGKLVNVLTVHGFQTELVYEKYNVLIHKMYVL